MEENCKKVVKDNLFFGTLSFYTTHIVIPDNSFSAESSQTKIKLFHDVSDKKIKNTSKGVEVNRMILSKFSNACFNPFPFTAYIQESFAGKINLKVRIGFCRVSTKTDSYYIFSTNLFTKKTTQQIPKSSFICESLQIVHIYFSIRKNRTNLSHDRTDIRVSS